MKGIWKYSADSITAYKSTRALSAQPALPQDVTSLAHACKHQLADPKTYSQDDVPVEILIGGDHYWKIVKDCPPIRISTSKVLIRTEFGWILSRNRSRTRVN
jgi:hypothetical protein